MNIVMDGLFLKWAKSPEWEYVGKVHDWRNYISDRVREMWSTFSDEQLIAIVEQAYEEASKEHWD